MNDKNISSRGFLKTAAAIGTALAVEPMLEKVQAASHLVTKDSRVSSLLYPALCFIGLVTY